MTTAFVRFGSQTKRFTDDLNQKEFAEELRANGYKVIKMYKGEVDWNIFAEWEFNNRKQVG